ncbi:hypothetical protein [Nocardioides sp. Root140]|uniref:hypothetical protein n=1 Tax=Nocardioides sp. Root140 TaxID=1736460 RepID=UPI0006F48732|nr:hypothetical protein [Nocardioides sp. Root140]KQY61421.1 hypothetical protein ASD30_25515 [Nocardioides sp. Root140]
MTTAPLSGSRAQLEDAATQWAALAPRLAARGRVRLSPDGGRNYPRRGERRITAQLPSQPAAVLLYDDNGCAPCLVLDLDTSSGGHDAVERDFRSLSGLLSRSGAVWFSDSSPSLGRHVYVPLAEPLPLADARALVSRLALLHPTLDPLPLASIASGCVRPPGAWHRSGGHQLLDQPLEAAVATFARPTTPRALAALGDLLPPAPAPHVDQDADALPDRLTPLRGYNEPDQDFQHIARTGDGWQDRYATPSEARQAVLWACVASGWALVDVVRRLEDGTWSGLASLYARYAPTQRRRSVLRDWNNALRHERQRREQPRKESVRVRPTSALKSQRGQAPGTVNQQVREWLTAVDLLLAPGTDLALRATLYALAEAAVLTDSLTVEHGNRSLAIALGVDQRTVGRALKQLLAEPADRALIDLVEPAAGTRANVYQLTIPPLLQPACAAKPWRRGRIHAVRPVFRELGLSAAFVYAALEQAETARGGRDIAASARLGVTATYEALQVLSTHGLATRTPAGWVLGDASLTQLAEAWGIVEEIRAQIARYREERRAWWAWLNRRAPLSLVRDESSPATPPPELGWIPEPPPDDDDESALEILERILGGHVIEQRTA